MRKKILSTLKQHHKRFLGMPFSKCIDKDPNKHPENDFYTRETCREFDYAQDYFEPIFNQSKGC